MNDPQYLKTLGAIVRAQTPEEAGAVYAELEAAIRSRQIGEITFCGDTIVSSRWIVDRNPMNNAITFRCSYKVNGKQETFTVEKDIGLRYRLNINDLLKEVFEDFAREFAKQFALDLLKGAAHAFRPEIESNLSQRSAA